MVVGGEIRRGNMHERRTRRVGGDRGASGIEIGNTTRVDDGVEMIGKLRLAGVSGGHMEEADIDAAGLARIEVRVELCPGTPEGGAREEVVAEHRMTEGLRLLHECMNEMAVVHHPQERAPALEVPARHGEHGREP